MLAASFILLNALDGKYFCICCCGKPGIQLLFELDLVKRGDKAPPCCKFIAVSREPQSTGEIRV